MYQTLKLHAVQLEQFPNQTAHNVGIYSIDSIV